MTKVNLKSQKVFVDFEKKDNEFKKIYNQLGFLTSIVIQLMDMLAESNRYNKTLKYAGNMFLKCLMKLNKEHFLEYENHGVISNGGFQVHSKDIYNTNSKAYDEAFEFFTQRPPNEVISIMTAIKTAEEKGLDLTEVLVSYIPLDPK